MEINEKSNEIAQRTGRNIKNLREQKGLTQHELALRVNVAQPTVANWEQGKREPELSTLVTVAGLFNVTLDDLVLKEITPPIPMYARNLAYLRRKHGMTQQQISELLGYSGKQGYNAVETGKSELSVDKLVKLADFFGVTIDQIVKQDLLQGVNEWEQ